MSELSDGAVGRLRALLEEPDLGGTRYRLIGRLGRGGMGTVWLAEDSLLERKVALKVLDVPDAEGLLAARLEREARILAHLEHPGIVPVHDVGRLPDGRTFYAMKHVEGERLDRLAPRLELAERVRALRRVVEAVGFAHARGVLHRDLKPANVMVGPFGEVLVMDWGIARVLGGDGSREPARRRPDGAGDAPAEIAVAPATVEVRTGQGDVLGTPGWMAPEQARGDIDALDARTDIYGLGLLLRFLLPTPAPRALSAVATRATASEPHRRYPDAAALGADIDRWLDGLAVDAHRESLIERARRLAARHRTAIALILTYLAVRAFLLLRGQF